MGVGAGAGAGGAGAVASALVSVGVGGCETVARTATTLGGLMPAGDARVLGCAGLVAEVLFTAWGAAGWGSCGGGDG